MKGGKSDIKDESDPREKEAVRVNAPEQVRGRRRFREREKGVLCPRPTLAELGGGESPKAVRSSLGEREEGYGTVTTSRPQPPKPSWEERGAKVGRVYGRQFRTGEPNSSTLRTLVCTVPHSRWCYVLCTQIHRLPISHLSLRSLK